MIPDALLHKGGELVALLNVFQGQSKNNNAIIVEGVSDWFFWKKFIHKDTKLYAFSNKSSPKKGPKTNKEAVKESLEKISKGVTTRTSVEKLPEGCSVMGIVDEDHDLLLNKKSDPISENPRVFLTTTRPFRDRENMLLHFVNTPFDSEALEAKQLVRKIGILRAMQQKKRDDEKENKVRWDLSFNKDGIYQFLKHGNVAQLIEVLVGKSKAKQKLAPTDEWIKAFEEGCIEFEQEPDSKTIQGHDWVCGIVMIKNPHLENGALLKKHEKGIEDVLAKMADEVIKEMPLVKNIRKKEGELQTKFLL